MIPSISFDLLYYYNKQPALEKKCANQKVQQHNEKGNSETE